MALKLADHTSLMKIQMNDCEADYEEESVLRRLCEKVRQLFEPSLDGEAISVQF